MSGGPAYGASKAGLLLITKVMATELGGQGVTINAIAPGPIETQMAAALHTERYAAGLRVANPGPPLWPAREVAAAAMFLASEGRATCAVTPWPSMADFGSRIVAE